MSPSLIPIQTVQLVLYCILFCTVLFCSVLNCNLNDFRDVVTYPGFVDCVYLGASNELYLDNGLGDIISIKNTK